MNSNPKHLLVQNIISAFFNMEIRSWNYDRQAGSTTYIPQDENAPHIVLNWGTDRNEQETEKALWRIIVAAAKSYGLKTDLEPVFTINYSQPDPVEERIKWMNKTFELDCNDKPTDLGTLRLYEFESILHEELSELKQARQASNEIARLVALADLLGDVMVYIFSEAARWGIPLVDVFHLIMDSQESKLVDGKPLKAPDGSKFIKGPNYHPPEDRIRDLIVSRINNYKAGT